MQNETIYIRKLTKGDFLCAVTNSEAVEYLKTEVGFNKVSEALSYQGLKLVSSPELDYWYAAYEDLSHEEDLKNLKKDLIDAFSQSEPFLAYMKLIMEAKGDGQYPDIHYEFHFGEALVSIERSDVLKSELTSLTNKKFFTKASGKANISDKFRAVVDIAKAEGLLEETGESGTHYTFTGKLSYHVALIRRAVSDLPVEEDPEDSLLSEQESLRLF